MRLRYAVIIEEKRGDKMKLEELLAEWMESVCGTVKERTVLQYRHIVNAHIKPYYVDIEVDKITTKDLQ